MTEKEEIEAWIIDETGFSKQGKHSVGVQRQYTASAGKVTNCQIGVSLTLSTREDHVPVDFELYLPKSWTTDRERREATRIPSDVSFATKPELGLQMIRRAIDSGLPRGTVLADATHGGSKEFRADLRQLGLDYAVAVNPTTNVRPLDRKGAVRDHPCQPKTLARELKNQGAFRRCTWRQGSRRAMTAQFARVRVQVGEQEQATLLIEWRDNEHEPANYLLISMAELPPSNKQLVSLVMQRWRTERTYQDIKGELGLLHARLKSPGRRDRMLLIGALAIALLTIPGAAGEGLGFERLMKANTVKRRSYSLFRQGLHYDNSIPNMKADRLKPWMARVYEFLAAHAVFNRALGLL